MKIVVILAHPTPGSFNHAIAQTIQQTLEENGHTTAYHDLYAERFDPLLPSHEIPKHAALDPHLEPYCEEIRQAEGIAIVHPNWWGMPPAILTGWIDRVIRPGIAYEFEATDSGEGIPIGLLPAKAVLIFNTANTPPQRERDVFGDPLDTIWKNCVFGLCGIQNVDRRTFSVIVTSTPNERERWLKEVRDTVNRHFPQQD